MKSIRTISLLAAGALVASAAVAQDKERDRDQVRGATSAKVPAQDRDRDIYGYQLMSAQERTTYRAQMHMATTAEQREKVRAAHHEQMKARAKERGVTLPDAPPEGRGPGSGSGMGGGMGPGPRGGGGGPGGR